MVTAGCCLFDVAFACAFVVIVLGVGVVFGVRCSDDCLVIVVVVCLCSDFEFDDCCLLLGCCVS